MTTPTVAEPEGETPSIPDSETDGPSIQSVELGSDDFSEGLFDDEETASDETDETVDDGTETETETGSDPAGSSVGPVGIETAIVDGAARLGVVGLDQPEKSELEAEFKDVFEAMRLGHFGAQAAEKYILLENEDIDPAWGCSRRCWCVRAWWCGCGRTATSR